MQILTNQQEKIVKAKDKKPKLGSGKRFAAGVSKLEKEGKSEDSAKAIMAAAGRRKQGK